VQLRMRIGVDVRPLSRPRAGISRVVFNTILELQRIDQQNTYFLYCDREFELPFHSERWRKRIHSRFRFLPGTLWLQTEGKSMILRDKLDVFWGTAHVLPLGLPSEIARVVTIHDLVWRFYPATMGAFSRCMHRVFVERSIQQANKVISVSESTARDLQRILNVPEAKIEVIHHGVGPAYKPHDPSAAAEYVASKYGVSKDYVLTVGTVEPRKNLVTLIDAIKILRDRGDVPGQLLIAGAKGWKNTGIHARVRECGLTSKETRFLGYVPEEDLPLLYSGARLFLFPSLYEGFGLPLVEAMACGAPIVASNVSSIPEVVEGAAVLVSPQRPEEFAAAILRVSTDVELRAALVKKGLERAQCFRWQVAAQELLKAFETIPKDSNKS